MPDHPKKLGSLCQGYRNGIILRLLWFGGEFPMNASHKSTFVKKEVKTSAAVYQETFGKDGETSEPVPLPKQAVDFPTGLCSSP